MKVTFYSNRLTPHQLPFCQAMSKLIGDDFTFVATKPILEERLKAGYPDMNKQYPFVLTTYDSDECEQVAQKLALTSDVIITGSAPEKYTLMRIRENKLTFRYSERWYKQGLKRGRYLRAIVGSALRHWRFIGKPIYMLCASAYTSTDCAKFGNYLGKTYKWGYFPEVKTQDADALMARKRSAEKVSLLWAGRMLNWKHPEVAIHLAERLRADGVDFEMKLIGSGEMASIIREQIRKKGLEGCIHMTGEIKLEAVREHMEDADIFLFTSDFNEGWGAVLNEAMNSGCAVVASHAIGSVPFLIEDGVNGFVYKNGDDDGLYKRVRQLVENPVMREEMGRKAYRTMENMWNADVAAERFLSLAQALMDGKKADLYEDGPCSRAGILQNDWYC